MKLSTLRTRYKNIGYTPCNLERDIEVAAIAKWIYETHGIYIQLLYITMGVPEVAGKFSFMYYFKANEGETAATSYGEKYYKNPYDGMFDAVARIYRHLKFMYY